MLHDLPPITIITPCRNGEQFILDAIESVRLQQYPHIEHIVVDALSTDSTLSLVARHPDLIVLPGPDAGAHDAMNKGIEKATGDVIGFLNVDDIYPDNTLAEVGKIFAENPDVDVVIGNSVVFEEDAPGHRAIRFLYAHAPNIELAEMLFGNPGINGWFFRRSVFAEIGQFNNDFFICADRHFVIRIALAGLCSVTLEKPTIWYRAHVQAQTTNRAMSNILDISLELFRMASDMVRSTRHDSGQRRLILAWHAFEGGRCMLLQLRRGNLGGALDAFVRCGSLNPLWPARLFHALRLRQRVRQYYLGGWDMDLSAAIGLQPVTSEPKRA
jgi:glycosyltransferase involved in cell wall biosynthesis